MKASKMTVDDLNNFMKQQRLTPIGLAKLLGVTKPAVDHWLTGRREIPPTTVKLLCFFNKYPTAMPEFETMLQDHHQ